MTPLPIKIVIEKTYGGTLVSGTVNLEFRQMLSPEVENDTVAEAFHIEAVARALLRVLYGDKERAALDACRTLTYTTPTHDTYREAYGILAGAFSPEYTVCVKRK